MWAMPQCKVLAANPVLINLTNVQEEEQKRKLEELQEQKLGGNNQEEEDEDEDKEEGDEKERTGSKEEANEGDADNKSQKKVRHGQTEGHKHKRQSFILSVNLFEVIQGEARERGGKQWLKLRWGLDE